MGVYGLSMGRLEQQQRADIHKEYISKGTR